MNKFDLIERTSEIGKNVILLCKSISPTIVNRSIISQFVRSSTSIGANYCEATEANSKKDFCNKLTIAKKEAKETLHWIKMIETAEPYLTDQLVGLADEIHQIILILSASIKKSSANKNI